MRLKVDGVQMEPWGVQHSAWCPVPRTFMSVNYFTVINIDLPVLCDGK